MLNTLVDSFKEKPGLSKLAEITGLLDYAVKFYYIQIIYLGKEADLNFGSRNMLIMPINFLGEDLI